MKIKIFNTLTAVAGIGAMVNHVMTDVYAADLGTLALIWAGTAIVSFVGTTVMVNMDAAKQNRKEREYVEMLKRARALSKR